MFETRTLPTGIGLEVLGVPEGAHLDDAQAAALRALWHETGLLLFRGVATSPEALIRLSRCFGELEPHPIERFRMPGQPELILLTNEGGPLGPIYLFDGVPTYGRIPWHTDLAFTARPNAGALLRMVRRVETGGRTGWLDTAAAYDALDAQTRTRIDGLDAMYVFCKDLAEMRFLRPDGQRIGEAADVPDYPPTIRPIVWRHPITGRTILNLSALNIDGIVGLERRDSDALIQALLDHVTQPRFTYLHDWREDDVMLWDNYRMMHQATGHPVDEVRIVQRSTLRGDVEIGRVISGTEAEAA